MSLSFEQIRELLSNAIRATEGKDYGCYIVNIWSDSVVYESRGTDNVDKYYQRSYAIIDEKVTLGDPVAVEKQVTYVPMQAAGQIMAAAQEDGSGYKWNVRIVAFGKDKNGNYWDKDVLTAAVDKFEGAKVFALEEAQHQAKPHRFGKSVRDLVGIISNVTTAADGLYGALTILPAAKWLRDNLVGCAEMGLDNVLGLSVDVKGKLGVTTIAGQKMQMMTMIASATVDVVYEPVAKGEFLTMAAAVEAGQKEETDMLKKLLAALVAVRPDLAGPINEGLQAGTMTEDQALGKIVAATNSGSRTDDHIQALAGEAMHNMQKAQAATGIDETRIMACEVMLISSLAASKLPDAVQDKLRASYEGTVFTREQLQAAIKAEKDMLDKLTASGVVTGAGDVRVTTDQLDKHGKMLDDFFAGNGVHSFKACYQEITGDMKISGELRDASRLSASISSTTFDLILGDALTRRMQEEYNASGLDDWRKIVDVVPLNDFRTQHRTRMGGYGDLPTVSQGNPYTALTSPDDAEATYAASKKGGTEDITLEAIRNDDAGVIRRVPVKLSRAAARTLYKFVFGFISGNAAIYDSVALFHATHANLGAAALTKATLQAGRLAMMKQTEAGSLEPLGIAPRFIIVPSDLEDAAYELTAQPNLGGFTPTAPDAVRKQTWDIIGVKTWTDANNWYLAADPKDIPCIEVGFLDGKEMPELFVQDMPNVGSMFSNDKLTYKIRHIYGGGVVDYLGLYGAVVA